VVRAKTSEQVFELCSRKRPDLLILEQQLEEMDGVDVMSEIRETKALKFLPVIFYSELHDKYTQLAAFNAGADMFVNKGLKAKLFLARITALLRRSHEMTEPSIPVRKFGDIVIDEEEFLISRNGKHILLSKKEFQLLLLLTSKPGKVFKRQQILSEIWGDDIIVGDRNIDTHIKKLRKKLGKETITTARGVGYKFIPPDSE
jgi:two-component system alkaline phosphatase synthesis response regulator PhoP